MRNVKNAFILLLILSVCLTCTGCSAFQTQMAKTITRMAKVQNFHTDVEANLSGLLNISGQEIWIEALLSGGFDTETDPLLIKTDLHLETFGVERELRFYVQKDDNTWNICPWDEISAVSEESAEQQATRWSISTQALKLLMKCGEYFADPVDDEVNGAYVKRYDGMFPNEYVDEMLVLLNLKGKEETAAPEEALIIPEDSEENSAEIQESEAAEETEEETQELLEGLPGSIWINDDNMIVQVDIDLAVFLQKLMGEGLDKLLAEYDLDGLELDGELQHVDTRLTFSRFDEVEPLSVPEP